MAAATMRLGTAGMSACSASRTGAAWGRAGHRASISPNALSRLGYPTAFELSTNPTLRYAIGAIARPRGWGAGEDVATDGETLTLRNVGGETLAIPFAGSWLLGDTPALPA